jgi:DNA-binding transcriptional MerR regulator
LTLPPCEALYSEPSCSPSETSPSTAGCRSACCVTTTPSGCYVPRTSIRPAATYYRAEQLTQLNRIVALKELGFGLHQIGSIVHDAVTAEELRGMMRLRRAELETAVAEAAARLAMVEARLRTIESENLVPTDAVVVKSLPALRVAELTGTRALRLAGRHAAHRAGAGPMARRQRPPPDGPARP